MYPDEAMDGTNALQVIAGAGPQVFFPQNSGREGLFMDLQAVALLVFGQREPWVLRSVSGVFGILIVLGMFLFIRAFLDGDVSAQKSSQATFIAYGGAFFAATSFWLINFSRIGFRAIMAPAFLVWTVYFLVRALKNYRQKHSSQPQSSTRGAVFLLMAGVVYGLGMYSYIAYRVTPLLIIFLFLLLRRLYALPWRQIMRSFIIFSSAAFLTALPLLIYFIHHPADFFGRTSELSIFATPAPWQELFSNILKTAGMLIVSGDMNWRQNISGSPALFWPVALFFCIGFGGMIAALVSHSVRVQYRHYRQIFFLAIFMVVWTLISFLPVIFSNEGIPHALRSILMIPAVFGIAGIGVYGAYDFLRDTISFKILSVFGILSGVGLIIYAFFSYFIVWAQNPAVADAFNARSVAIARQIDQIPTSLPTYVVVNIPGTLVDGIPVSAQTVMFMTDTYNTALQQQKNIHYVTEADEKNIPADAAVFYLEEQ